MSAIVNGTTYELPLDDGVATKVPSYNAVIIALAMMTESAWASWTPTWTNLTLGNGVVTAKYAKIGKLVFFRLSLVFGTTTSISGDVQFTLPVTRAANAGTASIASIGLLSAFDTSVPSVVKGTICNYSTTQGALRIHKSDGTYLVEAVASSTVPFTWATGDEIHAEGCYEAA